ncbi:hypothetical protein OPQ81_001770 [Rhizoctonia solani]|nr:hypothetical protein OPQ81_001770 [Rhizoctonia solani]
MWRFTVKPPSPSSSGGWLVAHILVLPLIAGFPRRKNLQRVRFYMLSQKSLLPMALLLVFVLLVSDYPFTSFHPLGLARFYRQYAVLVVPHETLGAYDLLILLCVGVMCMLKI